MTGSTDGTFALLCLQQQLELGRLAPHLSKLLNLIEIVQATSAPILAPEQGRELAHRLTLPATVACSHVIHDALVLDTMHAGSDQMIADGSKYLTCPSRDLAEG